MAKSNAERQAAYRRRHLHSPEAGLSEMLARLSIMVAAPTKWQLERLALHHGVTQRQMLERLALHHGVTQRQMLERVLDEAERRLLEEMPSRAQEAYYDRRTTLHRNR
jgi:hypothetical protein